MRLIPVACMLLGLGWSSAAFAQSPQVQPRIVTRAELQGRIATVKVAPRFVTAIRVPEVVNSVVVGDPAKFQVEHAEREPQLVFVKVLTIKPAQTNLLISTRKGQHTSLLLVSRGDASGVEPLKVDFLVRYETPRGFLIEPAGYPFPLIGETVALSQHSPNVGNGSQVPRPASLGAKEAFAASAETGSTMCRSCGNGGETVTDDLDQLLDRQQRAPLPRLYGERIAVDQSEADRIRAGVSEVIDGGQRVIVLFSIVNPTKQTILLMPPQVQLAGRTKSGKLIKRSQWSTADQLAVLDFRLTRRRVGSGERADGLVVFERPPYKRSNEMLLLQIAESGAVDRPALVPVGFGVSTSTEVEHGRRD
ncbi:MAG: hypothetical protein L0387_25095 [Acidobacteria bacterium]|nr:hypothetical protein [Acidobacteriota bacterium]MCI0717730.1 hypothetical protein [Acidobacteriota bacterium]